MYTIQIDRQIDVDRQSKTLQSEHIQIEQQNRTPAALQMTGESFLFKATSHFFLIAWSLGNLQHENRSFERFKTKTLKNKRSSMFTSFFILYSFRFMRTFLQQNSYFSISADNKPRLLKLWKLVCKLLNSQMSCCRIFFTWGGMRHERYITLNKVKELHVNNTACVTCVKFAGQH